MNTRLKEIRKALELTQSEFAKKLNLSQNHISSLENGSRAITTRISLDLERIFNVNINFLETGSGDMFIEPKTLINEDTKELLHLYNLADNETKHLIKALLKKSIRDF
ncbi:MAG: helix-turn-helix transcriptional regulator [Clostridium chrysemydis]|uniref:helix-turn-helix transcriptional regulator n=1 Tax=Clostridium TaxID=1485 RepID=UPI0021521F25|nr:helix-turn-helix transcriptional regulator [Clostridium sp. LY3-2]MCR6516290.1 helix-turn-helix transcriptional regulator [Clostridium sp. LY3-2]